ncbi:Target of rapamycin complex subunit lst8 [Portunus trituberculatus]|uniref:Target of rapamycin complex subunit lst8 n=1 Tax=Portunus trituberculatus TaxID=210409 RepID=A0A5B7E2H5_PORTR|nr:Target of rapamycin complex subunit lst8 [Portunus trituberculatus]
MEITPNRQQLAAAGYQHIRMYDLKSLSEDPVINFEGISKNVTALGFQEDGKWMFTGGEDSTAKIWDLRSYNLHVSRIFQVNSPVTCACLHPNQAELFVGDQSGVIHIWDIKTEHYEQLMINYLDSSSGSMMVTTSADHTARIWKTADFSQMTELNESNQRWVWDVAFSADSQHIITGSSDNVARLWSVESGEVKREYSGHQKAISAIAFKDVLYPS